MFTRTPWFVAGAKADALLIRRADVRNAAVVFILLIFYYTTTCKKKCNVVPGLRMLASCLAWFIAIFFWLCRRNDVFHLSGWVLLAFVHRPTNLNNGNEESVKLIAVLI